MRWLMAIFCVWGLSLAQAQPQPGQVWSLAEQRWMTAEQFQQRVLQANILWLGEIHDNDDHHQKQAEVLSWFVEAGRVGDVVFEMMNSEDQPTLDTLKPLTTESVLRELQWDERGWPAAHYRVVVDAAVNGGWGLVAGNISRPQAMQAWRSGPESVLDEAVLQRLRAQQDVDSVSDWLVQRMVQAHCQDSVDEHIALGMLRAQRSRDAELAQNVYEAAKPVIAVVGRIHARYDVGAPRFLSRDGVVSVGLMSVDDEAVTIEDYLGHSSETVSPFDYLWFTTMDRERPGCP